MNLKRHTQLKRDVSEAADSYWAALNFRASPSKELEIDVRARTLAKLALRLHIFEQGRRSKARR